MKKIDWGDKKTYIVMAVVVVIVVVLYFIIKKLWNKASEALDRKKLVEEMGQDIKDSELTYTDSQYLQYAETVYQALNDKTSGFWGVDQKKIYGVYEAMKNASDVLKLHDKFGSRAIDASWTMGGKDGTYTLAQAIPVFLTKGQLKEVNSILAENGVNFSY